MSGGGRRRKRSGRRRRKETKGKGKRVIEGRYTIY
jgi:hypothetical protein